MSIPLPVPVAWQGLTHRLPADWEVAGTYGDWRTGSLLFARDREPMLRVSWQRTKVAADLQRTLARAQRRLMKETGFAALPTVEAVGKDGALARCVGREGQEMALAVRVFATGVTAIWRQLRPGGPAELRAVAAATVAVRDDEPKRWAIHGLDCTLPADWRCEGVQALAGLSRGVWFHTRGRLQLTDQVLVLRRMACAARVVGERGLEAWLRSRLERRETAEAEPLADGAVHLTCRRPARNWWRRLRGGHDIRHLHAWIESDTDRLNIQEWKGSGEPLACLRNRAPAQGSTPPNDGRSSG